MNNTNGTKGDPSRLAIFQFAMNFERSIKEFPGLGSAFPDLDGVTKIVQGDASNADYQSVDGLLPVLFPVMSLPL